MHYHGEIVIASFFEAPVPSIRILLYAQRLEYSYEIEQESESDSEDAKFLPPHEYPPSSTSSF